MEHFITIIMAVVAALVSGVVTTASVVWMLSGRFTIVERLAATALDRHEEKDQRRHEENLERFSQIKVALALLGKQLNGN